MKKSSLSLRKACRFLILAFLFVVSSATPCLSRPTTPFPRRNLLAHHVHRDPCKSFSHEKPRALCEQLRRSVTSHAPPLPPPPPEIDPIYGVDKRLVPSGPNPLHN